MGASFWVWAQDRAFSRLTNFTQLIIGKGQTPTHFDIDVTIYYQVPTDA